MAYNDYVNLFDMRLVLVCSPHDMRLVVQPVFDCKRFVGSSFVAVEVQYCTIAIVLSAGYLRTS